MEPHLANPIEPTTYRLARSAIADPAAGNPATFACPSNARIRLTALTMRIATLAGPQHPLIEVTDLATFILTVASSNAAIPNLTTQTAQAASVITEEVHLSASNLLTFGLSDEIWLQPGETLRLTTDAIAGTVQISNCAISYDLWTIA